MWKWHYNGAVGRVFSILASQSFPHFDVIGMATQAEDRLKHYEDRFTMAVMGCIVTAPARRTMQTAASLVARTMA